MVRKDNTALLAEVNRAIKQMDRDDPNWRDDLKDKYYGEDNGDKILFTAAEKKYIAEAKSKSLTLTAIVNPDRSPYSYYDNGSMRQGPHQLAQKSMRTVFLLSITSL